MRLTVLACIATIGLVCGCSSVASAGQKAVVKTKTYKIAGTSGRALLVEMDRRGPKHGFMTRAIAQTGYTVDWELDVSQVNGVCRLRQANGTLNLTYMFPHVASALTPVLRKRWNRFFAGVRAHEETHGRLAMQMVRVAARSVAGLTTEGDPQCSRTRSEAKRRLAAVYNQYEAKQVAFDAREHRDGGKVERLVLALADKH